MPFVTAPFEKEYSRIVSVVPSQTELLSSLGLDAEVLGVTKFCIHPHHWRSSRTVVGGTKKLNIDKIRQLRPDLIIANREENQKEDIELLSEEFDIYLSEIDDLESSIRMITDVGSLTGKLNAANKLAESIRLGFEQLVPLKTPMTTAYLIWKNPYMAAGNDCFINDMLKRCGFINSIDKPRYPEINTNELINLNPDVVLLSSEPYPFKEKHISELSCLMSKAKILLVDGECFSWYGSRLIVAPSYFQRLINDIEGA